MFFYKMIVFYISFLCYSILKTHSSFISLLDLIYIIKKPNENPMDYSAIFADRIGLSERTK